MGSFKSTTIEMDSVEEYEAVINVLCFLNKRCLVKSAHQCIKEIKFSYEDAFSRCPYCDEPRRDCEGHDEDPVYDDRFNDESAFD